ncbi:hypothetical protein BBJ28_00012101 [Nothophytophthora sp. Chile5]|nr:hypothetical protein BBJ28_00012101 [Nothophytophthora sp. Chile5]
MKGRELDPSKWRQPFRKTTPQHEGPTAMDPMKMLEMGHRSGVSQTEVDDFADRMDLVRALSLSKTAQPCLDCDLRTHHLALEEIERQEQLIREAERRKREEERQRKAKQEEHDAWWHKAELRFSLRDAEGEDKEASDSIPRTKSAHWANRVLAAYKARDANDYSLWDQWEPEDPVSLQEQAEREAELDKLRNREFENSNPDFCSQFKKDMEERQRSQEEKARTAERE